MSSTVADMRYSVIEDLVGKHIPENAYPEQWDAKGLKESVGAGAHLAAADRRRG